MRNLLRRFIDELDGATALEYALIAVLVSISFIAGASTIGTSLSGLYFNPILDGFRP